MDSYKETCQAVRIALRNLQHTREWHPDKILPTAIQECVEGCENLLSYRGDLATERAYLKQAQDIAEQLLGNFTYLLCKLGLMERCYNICPVPTLLSNALSHAFHTITREEDEWRKDLYLEALRIGGVPTPKQVEGFRSNLYGNFSLPRGESGKRLLENTCRAEAFLFSTEHGDNAYQIMISCLLANAFDDNDCDWAMEFIQSNQSELSKLMCIDDAKKNESNNQAIHYYLNVFHQIVQHSSTTNALAALNAWSPQVYDDVVFAQEPSITHALFMNIGRRVPLDLTPLPLLHGLGIPELEFLARNVAFGSTYGDWKPLTFNHFEMFDKNMVYQGGKPGAIARLLVKNEHYAGAKMEFTALVEAMKSEKSFVALVTDGLSSVKGRNYDEMHDHVVAVMCLDKNSQKIIRDPEIMSRMAAYFMVAERVDITKSVGIERTHITLSDFQALAVLADNETIGSYETLNFYSKLMRSPKSESELARISFNDFQKLRKFQDRFIPENQIRKISWKSHQILEEVLGQDLGL